MVFHYVALLIDWWLRLRRHALETWRILPGDLLGRLVLRGCGVRSPGRAVTALDGTDAILIEDPRTARYLDRQRIAITAQTLGRYVLARDTLTPELINHEMEHVRQWRRLGPLFLPAYLLSSGIALAKRDDPYWANSFEISARARAAAAGTAADFRVNA